MDGSSYSDAEATLVAGIAWPAGSAVRVLAVVPERLPLLGLSLETQRMVDESLSDLHQQEWAAAETLTTQVANRLRAHDLAVEVLVREGRPAELILEQAVAHVGRPDRDRRQGAQRAGLVSVGRRRPQVGSLRRLLGVGRPAAGAGTTPERDPRQRWLP